MPKLKERVKLLGLSVGGKFELKDQRLLVVNLVQSSSVLAYEWFSALETEDAELSPFEVYG